jgi:uncharacterized membrane protein
MSDSRDTAGQGRDLIDAPNASDTSRLETFADAVIAIAITLLILEIDVPHVEPGASLGRALGEQWPSYAGYLVSFLTIGVIWVNHHHMFTLIERSTHNFLVLNVVFLMTIAAIPWPTALLAEYVRDEGWNRVVATLVYGGTMTAVAIMFNVVWRYAAGKRHLLRDDVDMVSVERVTRSYVLGPVVYGTATLLALWNPWVSLVIFALLALYYTLPSSGPRVRLVRSR